MILSRVCASLPTNPDVWQTSEALARWQGSGEPNHTVSAAHHGIFYTAHAILPGPDKIEGFNIAHNTSLSAFEELSKFPRRNARYASTMNWFTRGQGFEPAHILEHVTRNVPVNGTVVDIGGSHGEVSIALARHCPTLRCVVQDLPEVVETCKSNIPLDVADRISYMAHDFFQPQPVKNADMYIFRRILHDWSDKYALRILKSLTPALKHGARIVICDHVLPELGELSVYNERQLR